MKSIPDGCWNCLYGVVDSGRELAYCVIKPDREVVNKCDEWVRDSFRNGRLKIENGVNDA